MPLLSWQGTLPLSHLGTSHERAATVCDATSYHDKGRENSEGALTGHLMPWPQRGTALCSYFSDKNSPYGPGQPQGSGRAMLPCGQAGGTSNYWQRGLMTTMARGRDQGPATAQGHICGRGGLVEKETPPSGLLSGIPASLGLPQALLGPMGCCTNKLMADAVWRLHTYRLLERLSVLVRQVLLLSSVFHRWGN